VVFSEFAKGLLSGEDLILTANGGGIEADVHRLEGGFERELLERALFAIDVDKNLHRRLGWCGGSGLERQRF
jgi:hypothetical protein